MKRTPLVRRTALKARKPMARSGPPKRKTRIAPRNEKRASVTWARAFHSEAYVAHVHSFECIVPGCESRQIEACHAVSRGAGGTWRDLFACCHVHHEIQHFNGIETFQRAFGVSVRDAADRVHERWLLIGGSPTVEV